MKSNLAIHSSSLKRSTNSWVCSLKKVLISFRWLATLSSTFPRDNQRMLEWNRSPLCLAPISSHNTLNKRVCKGRDLIKLTKDTTSLKPMARSSLWRRQWTTEMFLFSFLTKLMKPFLHPMMDGGPSAQTDPQSDHSSWCSLKNESTLLNICSPVVFLASGLQNKNCSI